MDRITDRRERKEDFESQCSWFEIEYIKAHDKSIEKYKECFNGHFLGLWRKERENPPSRLYIKIIGMEDCGAVMTEDGVVSITKDTAYLVKRTDVEELLKEGLVREIK